jgi:protein-tyrosine phosphatase
VRVVLPDGAVVYGRGLRSGAVPDPPPDWALYLLGKEPPLTPWPARWLPWPDFRLPRDRDAAADAFAEAHRRALSGERVEVACGGGRGRTGTALACIAVLAGVEGDPVAWVREHYDRRAVETPWQRRYARAFGGRGESAASGPA